MNSTRADDFELIHPGYVTPRVQGTEVLPLLIVRGVNIPEPMPTSYQQPPKRRFYLAVFVAAMMFGGLVGQLCRLESAMLRLTTALTTQADAIHQ